MTRRSNKKPIYNNVFSQIAKNKPSAQSATKHSSSTVALVGNNTSIFKAFYKTASLLLLISFLLQPMFVRADTDATDLTVTVNTQDYDVTTDKLELNDELTTKDDQTRSDTDELVSEEIGLEDSDKNDIARSSTGSESSSITNQESMKASFNELVLGADTMNEPPIATTTSSSEPDQVTVSSTVTATTTTTVQASSTDVSEVASAGSSTGSTSAKANELESQIALTTSVVDAGDQTDELTSTSDSDISVDSDDIEQLSENSETNASSTESADTNVVSVVQTAGQLSFNKNECTLIEDGSYYCQKVSAQPVQQDNLFSARDSDGDLEIYLRRSGKEIQITQNLVDDASPFFDPRSNTIVWHRLIDDRYQIVTYDIASAEEDVVTNTSVNNMEPSRSGDVIVWQRWVNNNWEIILYRDGEEVQLTDSVEHDISPNIRGDLVIWNVRSSDGTHSLKTYDISSGVYNDIKDPDGVAVANPRMVVMYDAVYSNGDTIMRGFDLVTGELIPLQQTPVPLPDELPAPDTTGETRALITPTQIKPEQDDTDTDTEPDNDSILDNLSDIHVDLDLSTSSRASSTQSQSLQTEFDLDLRTETTVSTSSVQTDDLVIPHIKATTSTSTHS